MSRRSPAASMRIAHALPFLAVTSWCSTTNAAGPQAPRVGRPSWPNSSRTLLTPLWLGRISIVSGVSTMGLCIVGIPARCAPTSPALNLRPRNRPPHHVTPLSGGWAVPVVATERSSDGESKFGRHAGCPDRATRTRPREDSSAFWRGGRPSRAGHHGHIRVARPARAADVCASTPKR